MEGTYLRFSLTKPSPTNISQENSRTLTLLAKDVDHFNVESTEFLIDDAQLTMLFADYTSNLHMYQYIPMRKYQLNLRPLLIVLDCR